MRLNCAFILLLIAGVASPAHAAERVDLLAVSDWGFLAPAQRLPDQENVARAMADYARRSGLRFQAVLVTGDNFKWKPSGGNAEQIIREGFEQMYDSAVLDMPFYAILGNHDYEYELAQAELDYAKRHPQSRWKMPGKWYRVDFPQGRPLVSAFMLDTSRDGDWKKQLQWLDEQLSGDRKPEWTIVGGHVPIFSDGQHGDSGSLQKDLGTLLQKHSVDFYLCGHDHVLEHRQTKGWTTTFLINGGGGENVKRSVGDPHGNFCRPVHGFMHFQFDSDRARVTILDEHAVPLHTFDRDRKGLIRIIQTTEP